MHSAKCTVHHALYQSFHFRIFGNTILQFEKGLGYQDGEVCACDSQKIIPFQIPSAECSQCADLFFSALEMKRHFERIQTSN